MPQAQKSAELFADYFVSYLFTKYHGTRHVRRVASWIGFIIMAIRRLAGASISRRRSRQLVFHYRDRQFKVRYNHTAGGRGGIEIVEVLPGRGGPEGKVVVAVTSLSDAEDVYTSLENRLNKFINTTSST